MGRLSLSKVLCVTSARRLVNASNPDYLSVNYQYDAAGRLLSRVMSSGARSIYAYDNGGWLSSLTHYDAAGNQVSTQSTNRDRLGHITTLTTAAGATNYTLDALYRLTTVAAPTAANSEAFSYDHIGNRLTATRGGTSIGATGSTTRYYNYYAATVTAAPVGLNGAYTQTYNNRLKEVRIGSASGTLDSSLTFDNEGRLTAQTGTGAKTLTWDPKSRVASVTTGSTTESYAYDPMDHRIQRSGGSLGNLSYYLEGDHLESVYSGGTLQEKYFRGSTIDELVAGYTYLSGSLTPFMFHHDQVMSVSATTKTNGGTQATQTFWAFGETQATTGTTVTRLGFTGRENDGTGLMQYRARYYDPVTGRFISEDPKKQAAGINFYAYVSNDPIDANDPSGELQFNTDGSIKFTPVDKPYPFWHASGEATIMQGGYVYANDGTPIQAYKNVGYNDHFNYDCHGMTFGNSQVWINNDQVPAILKGDSYTPITQPRLGDIVVYRDVDGVQHSATVTYIDMRTGAVSVTGKGGVTPSPETTPVKPGPDGGWYDPNATYQFYRQTTPSTPSTPQTPSQPSTGGGSGTSSVPGPKSSLDNGLDPVATSNGSVEGNSGGAAGGYLIYPNKPNNNNVLNVYRK